MGCILTTSSGAANCAGVIGKIHGNRTVAEIDDEQWDFIMRVNLTGMVKASRRSHEKFTDEY